MQKKKKAKSGRKPKVTPEVEKQIYGILSTGGSLKDAADYLEINASTIRRHKAACPRFARGVMKAVKSGKIRLIQKVCKSAAWQAAAWMLERRFGEEFGRKDKHELTGKNGGAVKFKQEAEDLDQLTLEELRQYRELRAKAALPGTN